jgi:protein TonB
MRQQGMDSLGLALLAALVIHGLVILGVSFDIDRGQPPAAERTLDITVVRPVKSEQPDNPSRLAQVSQTGGAEEQGDRLPSAPRSLPTAHPKPSPTPETRRSGVPDPEPAPSKHLLTARRAEPKAPSRTVTPPLPTPKPDIAQLLTSTQQEIDRLTAQMDRRSSNASHERRKAVNASTQEYLYATYLDAWRRKVEDIGNLNYPDEAKRRHLFGQLLLHVAVRADGSIEQIRLVRSSGYKILDDAAIRIVRLAAPFAPFPAEIRKQVDVLDITRTWVFERNNQLSSRR